MKPNTQRHEAARHKKLGSDRLSKSKNGNDCTQKRRGREICPGACRAEMSKRDNEQREAYAVTKKADDTGKQGIKLSG